MLNEQKLLEELEEQYDPESVIWFGKHNGKKWSDLPSQYLYFLIKTMDSPLIRELAKYELNERHK